MNSTYRSALRAPQTYDDRLDAPVEFARKVSAAATLLLPDKPVPVPGTRRSAVPAITGLPVERFVLLDLLRGIAAIAVLLFHAYRFLGVQLLPDAYLAVDLFFLLSGFVIAHNYDRKISGGMTFGAFITQRLMRLYPCFILALLLGVGLVAARLTRDSGYFDGSRLLISSGLNALFLPSYVMPNHVANIFPFNGSAWSLTFELLANAAFWILFPLLAGRRLWLLVVAAACADAIALYYSGNVDVGMAPANFWLGVPRVVLPFFMGVVLRRHVWSRFNIRLGGLGITAVIALLFATFSLSRVLSSSSLVVAEFFTIAIIYPTMIILVSRTVPGPRLTKLCKVTGDASYPLYLLQNPFLAIFAMLPQLLLHMKAKELTPFIGIAHIAATFLCALWVDRYYEWPARKWLKKILLSPTTKVAPVIAPVLVSVT